MRRIVFAVALSLALVMSLASMVLAGDGNSFGERIKPAPDSRTVS